jgi:hypothetical protein
MWKNSPVGESSTAELGREFGISSLAANDLSLSQPAGKKETISKLYLTLIFSQSSHFSVISSVPEDLLLFKCIIQFRFKTPLGAETKFKCIHKEEDDITIWKIFYGIILGLQRGPPRLVRTTSYLIEKKQVRLRKSKLID